MIPGDVWRHIAEVGGPLVRYTLSCCSTQLYDALRTKKNRVMRAKYIAQFQTTYDDVSLEEFWPLFLELDPENYFPPKPTLLAWYASIKAGSQIKMCPVGPTSPFVLCHDYPYEKSMMCKDKGYSRDVRNNWDMTLNNNKKTKYIHFRGLPVFMMYDFFDRHSKIVPHPTKGYRIINRVRYNLVIRLDKISRQYVGYLAARDDYQNISDIFQSNLSPAKRDAHTIITILMNFCLYLTHLQHKWYYVPCPEQNTIHFVIKM